MKKKVDYKPGLKESSIHNVTGRKEIMKPVKLANHNKLKLVVSKLIDPESHQLLKTIVDNISAVIYAKDLQGRYFLVNRCFCKLFHVNMLTVLGKTDYDIFPKDTAEAFRKMDEQIFAPDHTLREDETLLQEDGLHIYNSERSILRDGQGKPYGLLVISTEITEFKALEADLCKSIHEISDYRFALDESAIIAITNQKGIITYVNNNFCKISKYSKKELIGKDHRIINSGHHSKELMRDLWVTIANGKIWRGQLRNKAKDGTLYWVNTSIVPFLTEQGKPYQYLAIRMDITEQKLAEEKLQNSLIDRQKEVARIVLQAQEIERNALGRELHDNINQILASIDLKLEYCLENPENNTAIIEDCRENLQMAIQEARNLSHRMVIPRFSEAKLRDELEILIENCSYKQIVQLESSGMDEEVIPAHIKEALYRIAQEQLSNISKHAKADAITIQLSNDAYAVHMVIHDDGVGFDLQKKRKGIGITNIFSRVESYDGTVVIHSLPDKGCTISLTIPLPC